MAVTALAILCAAILAVLLFLPPIHQDPNYHNFADRRTLLGVPNFWDVAANAAFLVAAAIGVGALKSRSAFKETWERSAFAVSLVGIVMVRPQRNYRSV
jgi:hypothetical protein